MCTYYFRGHIGKKGGKEKKREGERLGGREGERGREGGREGGGGRREGEGVANRPDFCRILLLFCQVSRRPASHPKCPAFFLNLMNFEL